MYTEYRLTKEGLTLLQVNPSCAVQLDTRGTALTHLSKKVDVLTLAKISRHKDLSLLLNVYFRETADQIAARI